jgi:hypothetical protein
VLLLAVLLLVKETFFDPFGSRINLRVYQYGFPTSRRENKEMARTRGSQVDLANSATTKINYVPGVGGT